MKVTIGPYPKNDGERKVKVKVHKYDTWNADNTLAHIIYPLLVAFRETNEGSPKVADEDVPERLRSTSSTKKLEENDKDEFFHDRWNWVLDECIFAFGQLKDDEHDSFLYTEHGYDRTNADQYYKRIDSALLLFGKYYRHLWT